MVSACLGCHSNEVEWPWYSDVAPISWVVTRHVDEGRDKVNYSEFTVDRGDAEETIEVIRVGILSMVPSWGITRSVATPSSKPPMAALRLPR